MASELHFPLFGFIFLLFIIFITVDHSNARVTSAFIRSEWPSVDIPLDNEVFAVPKGYNAPQQVHITQGDYDGKAVIISWVTTDEPGPSKVEYGTLEEKYDFSAEGTMTNYTFYKYKSGYIHHCLVDGLEDSEGIQMRGVGVPRFNSYCCFLLLFKEGILILKDRCYDTKYYYKIGTGDSSRKFWFQTPPKIDPDAAYRFGIIGDLGQTYNSLSTLQHCMQSGGQTVLFVGDLSYADRYEYNDVGIRWDSWVRFIEQSAAYQPWIWLAGNHEIEYMPNMSMLKE